MKYRDVDDVMVVLDSGYMPLKTARTYSSNYRKKGDIKAVLVFVEAVERYLHKKWLEEQDKRDL